MSPTRIAMPKGRTRKFWSSVWRPETILPFCALIWIVFRAKPEFQLDEERFVEYARNLTMGFYADRETKYLWNGPGLPILLLPWIAFNWPLLVAKCLNAFWFAAALWAFQDTVKQMFIQPSKEDEAKDGAKLKSQIFSKPWSKLESQLWTKAFWAIGMYWLFFGAAWLPLLMTETLSMAAVSLSMAFYTRSLRHPRHVNATAILTAATLAFLALTRFFFGYVLLALLVFAMACFAFSREARRGVVICSLALVMCSPYLMYTYQLTGNFFYWGNAGGQASYSLTLPEPHLRGDIIPMDKVLEHPEISPTAYRLMLTMGSDEVENEARFRHAAWENIRNHPRKFFENWRANVNRLIMDYPFSRFPGSHQKEATGNLSLLFAAWFYALVLVVLIFLYTILLRRPRALLMGSWPRGIWVFGLVSVGALTLVSCYARFMFPLLPVVFLAMIALCRETFHLASRPELTREMA